MPPDAALRTGRGGAWLLWIPAAVLLVIAPEHVTRFHPLKAALAALALLPAVFGLRPVFVRRPETVLGLAFLCWGLLSLAWSPAPGAGLATFSMFCVAALYLVALSTWLHRDGGRQERVLQAARIWLVAGGLAAGMALYQRLVGWRLGLHRVTGPVGNPNSLAVVLVALLPAGWLLLRQPGRSRRRRRQVLGAAGVAVLLAGLWATGCHAAWVAVAGMVVLAILTAPLAGRWRGVLFAGVALAGLAVAVRGPLSAGARASLQGRWLLARISADVVAGSPVVGTGLGGYAHQAAWSQGALVAGAGGPWAPIRDAHHQGLQVAAELGLVGLVIGLALVGSLLWPLWRRRHEPVAQAALLAWVGLGLFALSESVFLRVEVLLFACGWIALSRRRSPSDAPEATSGPAAPRVRWATPALLWGVAGLAAFVQVGQLRADWLHARGLARLARIEGRTPDAEDLREVDGDYSAALASAVDRAEIYLARALLRRARGLPAEAEADARHAFAAQPSPDRALLLGDLALDRSDARAALWWYRVAVALHPRYARGFNNLAVALLRSGARGLGCEALWRALVLRPYEPTIRGNWIALCQPDAKRMRVARRRRGSGRMTL